MRGIGHDCHVSACCFCKSLTCSSLGFLCYPVLLRSPVCMCHWPFLFLPSVHWNLLFYVACFLFSWSQNSFLLSAFTYPFVLMNSPKLKNTTDIYYLGEFGSVGSRGSPFMQPSGVGESACWPGLRWADGLVGAGESASKIVHPNSCWKVGVGRRPQLLSLETPEQGSLRTEKSSQGVQSGRQGVFCDIAWKSHSTIPQEPVVTRVSPFSEGRDWTATRWGPLRAIWELDAIYWVSNCFPTHLFLISPYFFKKFLSF